MPTSTQLAADRTLIPLWDPAVPFPDAREMPDLEVVTHVAIERAQPGRYHYLHEPSIAWHRDRFYLCWANHPTHESNISDEVIRGRTSMDGIHWSEPSVWVAAPQVGCASFNHPVIFAHGDELLGFFVGWRDERPTTEIFRLDEATGEWQYLEASIPEFLPFCPPQRMADGNWIIGGELYWFEAAVAISHGDDLTQWETVPLPRPEDLKLIFPETAIINRGDSLLAFCRPQHTQTAPVSESRDGGRTWSELALSNFPLCASQPFTGTLSTGQQYLLTDNLEEGRCLLSIAVTGPEGGLFRRIFKLRHQQWPQIRLFGGWGEGSRVGMPTEWSYPSAIERDGNLYIAYTQGKEDCALSIVPLASLSL
ncbi:MAG: sialidase family protein [Armatimonadota bacterium]